MCPKKVFDGSTIRSTSYNQHLPCHICNTRATITQITKIMLVGYRVDLIFVGSFYHITLTIRRIFLSSDFYFFPRVSCVFSSVHLFKSLGSSSLFSIIITLCSSFDQKNYSVVYRKLYRYYRR